MTSEDTEDDVEIISSEDEKIKLIGEIFSNDSSRKILKLISNDNEMTANEIAQKNKMSLALVTHHLRRMQTAGMVKITKIGISVKGQDMKYYLATKQSFLIIPPEKTTHSIFKSLQKFSKFAAIGMAGFVSWMTLKPDGGNLQMGVIQETDQTDFTGAERSTTDEGDKWLSGSEAEPEVLLENMDAPSETAPEPLPEPEPRPEPEPSHSGVQDFELQVDSDFADAGSVSLDRTVYPEPFATTGAESVEPLIFSIIVPVAVIVGGIIIERLLTRWLSKRKKINIE